MWTSSVFRIVGVGAFLISLTAASFTRADEVWEVGSGTTFPTIQQAVNALPDKFQDNYVLSIHAGTYAEGGIEIVSKDTNGYSLTLRPHDSGAVIVTGPNPGYVFRVGVEPWVGYTGVRRVVFDNLDIRDGEYGVQLRSDSYDAVITRCRFSNILRNSIDTLGVRYCHISRNTIAGGLAGIFLAQSKGATVASNVIYDQVYEGIRVQFADYSTIINNTIVNRNPNNSMIGLFFRGNELSNHTVVKNNIVADCKDGVAAIVWDTATNPDPIVTYNNVTGNSVASYSKPAEAENPMSYAPGFIDPSTGNFLLSASSALIDKGDPSTSVSQAGWQDIRAGRRVIDRIDVGAGEDPQDGAPANHLPIPKAGPDVREWRGRFATDSNGSSSVSMCAGASYDLDGSIHAWEWSGTMSTDPDLPVTQALPNGTIKFEGPGAASPTTPNGSLQLRVRDNLGAWSSVATQDSVAIKLYSDPNIYAYATALADISASELSTLKVTDGTRWGNAMKSLDQRIGMYEEHSDVVTLPTLGRANFASGTGGDLLMLPGSGGTDYLVLANGESPRWFGVLSKASSPPTSPLSLLREENFSSLTWATGLAKAGNYVYVAGTEGVDVVSMSVPGSPVHVQHWNTPKNHVARDAVVSPSGAYLYVSVHAHYVLRNTDQSPKFPAACATDDTSIEYENCIKDGIYVFTIGAQGTITPLDLGGGKEPRNRVEYPPLWTDTPCSGGARVYVQYGINSGTDLEVSGSRLVVANGDSGVAVFDISSENDPTPMVALDTGFNCNTTFTFRKSAREVEVASGTAYVAAGRAGLLAWDLDDFSAVTIQNHKTFATSVELGPAALYLGGMKDLDSPGDELTGDPCFEGTSAEDVGCIRVLELPGHVLRGSFEMKLGPDVYPVRLLYHDNQLFALEEWHAGALVHLNVADRYNPSQVTGGYLPVSGEGRTVHVKEGSPRHAYVATGSSIAVIQSGAMPTLVKYKRDPYGEVVQNILGRGDALYVQKRRLGLWSTQAPTDPGFLLNMQTGGTMRSMATCGDYLFLTQEVSGGGPEVQVWNITNPLAPTMLANRRTTWDKADFNFGTSLFNLACDGQYAFIVSYSDQFKDGLLILDTVAQQVVARVLSKDLELVLDDTRINVAYKNNRLFINNGLQKNKPDGCTWRQTSGVTVINVANRTAPYVEARLGWYNWSNAAVWADSDPNNPYLLAQSDGSTDYGVKLFDVSTPASARIKYAEQYDTLNVVAGLFDGAAWRPGVMLGNTIYAPKIGHLEVIPAPVETCLCSPVDYCADAGLLCVFTNTCGPSGCCNYGCSSDPSCTAADPVPSGACGQ